jgi:hypothetical protein
MRFRGPQALNDIYSARCEADFLMSSATPVVDIYPAEYKIPGEHVQFDCRPCPASPSPNAVSGPHWRSSGSPTYQYLTNLRRKVHAAKQVLETRFRTQAIELGFGLQ